MQDRNAFTGTVEPGSNWIEPVTSSEPEAAAHGEPQTLPASGAFAHYPRIRYHITLGTASAASTIDSWSSDGTTIDTVHIIVPPPAATTSLPNQRLRAETIESLLKHVDGAEGYVYALLAARHCRPVFWFHGVEQDLLAKQAQSAKCTGVLGDESITSGSGSAKTPAISFTLRALDPPIDCTWSGSVVPPDLTRALSEWVTIWMGVLVQEGAEKLGLRAADVARHLEETMGCRSRIGSMAADIASARNFSSVVDRTIQSVEDVNATDTATARNSMVRALFRADPVAAACAVAALECGIQSETGTSPLVSPVLEGAAAHTFLETWTCLEKALRALTCSIESLRQRAVSRPEHQFRDLVTAWGSDLKRVLTDTLFLATEASYREQNQRGPVVLPLTVGGLSREIHRRSLLIWGALSGLAGDQPVPFGELADVAVEPKVPICLSSADVRAAASYLESYFTQLERALKLSHTVSGNGERFKCYFGGALTLIGTSRELDRSQARLSLCPNWPEHRGFDLRVDFDPKRGATVDLGSVVPAEVCAHALDLAGEALHQLAGGTFQHGNRLLMRGRSGTDRINAACAMISALTEQGVRTGTNDGTTYLHHVRSTVWQLRLSADAFADGVEGAYTALKRSATR